MKHISRKTLLITGIVVALIAGWLSASVITARHAEANLREFIAGEGIDPSIRLGNLVQRPGLFSSSGEFDISLVDTCDLSGKSPELLALHINYRLSHFILPRSLLRIEWDLAPVVHARTEFQRLFKGQAKLSGSGKLDFFGALHSDMNLPELQWLKDGHMMTISPSRGYLAMGRETLQFDWKTDKIVDRGEGKVVELALLDMQLDLKNRQRGIGRIKFGLDKITTVEGVAEKFSVVSEVVENGDRLDFSLTPSLKSANFGGKLVTDMLMQISINGLHAQSVEKLLDLSGKSCGFRNLTREEETDMRSAVRSLLAAGFSAGIPKLSGAVEGGSMEGKVMIELQKSAVNEIALATGLRSSGELAMTGKAITEEEKKSAIAFGLANETPLGLTASFDYANGVLKVNGRVVDTPAADLSLMNLDNLINNFLSGKSKPAAPAVIAPADLPAADDSKRI